jgi:hypothetical protein
LILKSKGIITDLQRQILLIFSKIPDSNVFYLTGGTALAEFYLGHRKSFDLDIFTSEIGIIIPTSYIFEKEIKRNFFIKVVKRFETLVEFEISDKKNSTKVQLALDSPFKFENPVDSDIGIKVNSYIDLKVKEFPDNINELPIEMIKEIDIKELKNQFLSLSKEIMEKIKNK